MIQIRNMENTEAGSVYLERFIALFLLEGKLVCHEAINYALQIFK